MLIQEEKNRQQFGLPPAPSCCPSRNTKANYKTKNKRKDLDEERSDDNAAADVAAAAAADLDAKADPPNDGGRKDQPKKRDSSKLQIQLINPQIRTNPQARKSIIQQMRMLLTDLHLQHIPEM